ncbi:MAG: proteobacterial dedicated sortase system response regulator [Gammaproteobacteria bacterium]|nr:proteobacterial dedicated sortase system response regulator [Gammaproteobacteria bacterium]
MARTVAIVEDEAAIRENYAEVLRRRGYQVGSYSGGASALQAFRNRLPDLVILDIALGDDYDQGFTLCRELRAMSATLPIIFLTARDSDIDVVTGLRLGADDYLTKDTSMPHLLARIAALFRRIEALGSAENEGAPLAAGDLRIDRVRFEVTWKAQPVPLTLTEFWIVHSLARRPGHVKNREQLMDEANVVVDTATITSHVKRIRRKFRELDPEFDSIEMIYGVGYRWRT